MKTKHTPGPWLYSPHYREHAQGHIYLPNANEDEAHTINLVGAAAMSQEQLDANAKLIAAAPDLLQALKGFIHSVEHEGEVHGRIVDAVRNAKEAIKKATE